MTTRDAIDSASVGDPELHLGMPALESHLASLPPAPRDTGRLRLLVRRASKGVRETPERARLGVREGFPGDAWGRASKRDPTAQLTMMEHDIAELIANGQPLALFGDQLFVDLDLSRENLPTGTRVRVGEALLEVTGRPHNGCRKFRARFGDEALRFVSRTDLRHRNFRGIYVRVIEDGEVAVGDRAEVVRE